MAGDPWDWWRAPGPYPIYQPPMFNTWTPVPKPHRIKVSFSGHQSHYEVEGDVIQWCSSAEPFRDQMIQVPAVVLNTGKEIQVVPLRKDLYTVNIETI